MKKALLFLAITVLFFTACATNNAPANEGQTAMPTAMGAPPSTPQQIAHWEPIVYERLPIPPAIESHIISCGIMPPHPVCGIPEPPAPVTIGCDLQRPPEPPPMITCAEPPYGPHPDTDTLSVE